MMLWGRTACFFVCALGLIADEPPLDPVPVCQATANWKDYDNKTVALLGRYSFRQAGPQKGRWLDQAACDEKNSRGALRLILNAESAPKPPEEVSLDEPALDKKLDVIRRHTSLGKFRFGSADYDRWAVVIGRMERRGEDDFQLTYRGDGAVFFLADH